jgi:ubiquinone/menaquinone biosynthesis C-methylase UbiE
MLGAPGAASSEPCFVHVSQRVKGGGDCIMLETSKSSKETVRALQRTLYLKAKHPPTFRILQSLRQSLSKRCPATRLRPRQTKQRQSRHDCIDAEGRAMQGAIAEMEKPLRQ